MFDMRSATLTLALAGALFSGLALLPETPASAASDKVYGCYKVTTSALNIRRQAFSRAPVVAVAARGVTLEKWKRFCSLRGFWCPVKLGNQRGHADKRFLEQVDCDQ